MKWLRNHTLSAWLISSAALLIMLVSTTPERVGPQGITIFFVLFYIWSFFTFALMMNLISKRRDKSLKQTGYFFSVASLAAIPTFVLALQSLGQLALRDVFIVLSLAGLIIFYWTKRGYN